MLLFLRNLLLACLGMMLLISMMAAGMMLWLVLLVVILLVMGYLALRKAGMIQSPRNPATKSRFDAEIIEAEYTVISETEKQIPQDRV